jgi:hypothetical protein
MVHVRRYAEQTANHDFKQRAEVSEWFGTVKAALEAGVVNPGYILTSPLAITYSKS